LNKKNDTLMIIGLGELGGIALEILARVPNITKIVTADLNEDHGVRRTNTALMGASYLNLYPNIEFVKIDLNNIEETAKIIREINPRIIYSATTLQSWWVIDALPKNVHAQLYKDFCGLGPWIPMHLLLVYKLMQAVKKSGVNSLVINSSFPDNVNAVLGKIGLAPNVGIGNIDLIVAPWRKVVSEILNVPLRRVQVYIFGHHYSSYNLGRTGTGLSAPYYLKIMVEDKDVTEHFKIKELAKEIPLRAKRTPGSQVNWIVAASAVKIILGILNDTNELSHAPGPEGLTGGYPVHINKDGAKVFLPEGMTREKAIQINEEAQKWDGIERIEQDGTVVFTDEAYKTFKDLLGYDCKEMKIEEIEMRAKELGILFKNFAINHGVNL
jgi:hypothetical protein